MKHFMIFIVAVEASTLPLWIFEFDNQTKHQKYSQEVEGFFRLTGI